MPLKPLADIESEINHLAILIGANEPGYDEKSSWWDNIPVTGAIKAAGYRGTRDAAVARILLEDDGYHLIARERGAEYLYEVVQDFESLLYHSFEEVIHYMAAKYAYVTNESWPDITPDQAWYRRRYAREADLHALISPVLADRYIATHIPVMQQFLQDANRQARVNRFRELLPTSPSRDNAWQTAQTQFPNQNFPRPP